MYELFKMGLCSVVCLIGAACVFMGFLLYQAVRSATAANTTFSFNTFFGRVELTNAAPGAVFVASGVVMILGSLYEAVSQDTHTPFSAVARAASLPGAAGDPAQVPKVVSQLQQSAQPGAKPAPVVVSAARVLNDEPVRFLEPSGGYYQKMGDHWGEFGHVGDSVPVSSFSEAYRDDRYVILYDGSRDMYVRLPIKGGVAAWSHANPISWIDMYYVTAQPGAAAPS